MVGMDIFQESVMVCRWGGVGGGDIGEALAKEGGLGRGESGTGG